MPPFPCIEECFVRPQKSRSRHSIQSTTCVEHALHKYSSTTKSKEDRGGSEGASSIVMILLPRSGRKQASTTCSEFVLLTSFTFSVIWFVPLFLCPNFTQECQLFGSNENIGTVIYYTLFAKSTNSDEACVRLVIFFGILKTRSGRLLRGAGDCEDYAIWISGLRSEDKFS